MKIRSITCFFDPRTREARQTISRLGQFAQAAREQYTRAGFEIQTTRLATAPFPYLYTAAEAESAIDLAQTLEADAKEQSFDYLSLGPALTTAPESYAVVTPVLAATQNVFLSGMLTTPAGEVSLPAVQACAEIIHQAATITPDGFANLRFAALANTRPNGPFFPGSYHAGERPAFALAMECADVVYSVVRKAGSLADAREVMVNTLETEAIRLTSVANQVAQRFDVDFRGIDFSLAPYPEIWCSFGAALEALGLPALGYSGSLAAAAFIADTLDRGSWLRTGFNGMMMPVLEDPILAQRAGEGSFTVNDLLMYSAVCGTGLDTVPLPGSVTPQQIAALLLDVASLALRLNKPLTARLMPLPGKSAGDPTGFDFSYFAPGRVMALRAAPLSRLLAGQETYSIRQRGS